MPTKAPYEAHENLNPAVLAINDPLPPPPPPKEPELPRLEDIPEDFGKLGPNAPMKASEKPNDKSTDPMILVGDPPRPGLP